MNFLLDTNAVIALLKGNSALLGKLQRQKPADFGIPSIVAHQLHHGAYKTHLVARNLARVDALQFAVVDFDKEDARAAGETRAVWWLRCADRRTSQGAGSCRDHPQSIRVLPCERPVARELGTMTRAA